MPTITANERYRDQQQMLAEKQREVTSGLSQDSALAKILSQCVTAFDAVTNGQVDSTALAFVLRDSAMEEIKRVRSREATIAYRKLTAFYPMASVK